MPNTLNVIRRACHFRESVGNKGLTMNLQVTLYDETAMARIGCVGSVLLEALAESRAGPDTLQMIDSTIVRAHQHAAGGKGGLVATLWAVRAVASRPRSTFGRTRKALDLASS